MRLTPSWGEPLPSEIPTTQWEEMIGGLARGIAARMGIETWPIEALLPPGEAWADGPYTPYHLGQAHEIYLGSRRKGQGSYYTPPSIAQYLTEQASSLPVLDLAAGGGVFLLATFYHQLQMGLSAWEALEGIYGMDRDPQAVVVCRLVLALAALPHLSPGQKASLTPLLLDHICEGNALMGSSSPPIPPVQGWPEAFGSILGNPPYIRNRHLSPEEKAYFKANYKTAYNQYDIYPLFIERGLSLLAPGGRLGFISSNKFSVARYGLPCRELILQNRVLQWLDLSDIDVFADAATYPAVYVIEKGDPGENQIQVAKPRDLDLYRSNPSPLPQSTWSRAPQSIFALVNSGDQGVLQQMGAVGRPLGELAYLKEGVHTGNVREKMISKEPTPGGKRVVSGRDCQRYALTWSGLWLETEPSLAPGEYFTLPDAKFYEGPKILLRDIAREITGALDTQGFYALNTLYSLLPKVDLDLEVLLGILHSRLANFFYNKQFSGSHVQDGFCRYKPMYLSQLPIPITHDADLKGLVRARQAGETEVDAQIDQRVYRLYHLSPEQIRRVEGM